MKKNILITSSFFGGLIANVLGGFDIVLITLLVCMGVDYVFGVLSASPISDSDAEHIQGSGGDSSIGNISNSSHNGNWDKNMVKRKHELLLPNFVSVLGKPLNQLFGTFLFRSLDSHETLAANRFQYIMPMRERFGNTP